MRGGVMRRRSLGLGAVVFSVALLMAACSSGDGSPETGGSSGSGSPETGGGSSGSTSPETGGGTEDQTVTISNFTFDPSTLALPSGQEVTIEVTNKDDVEHSFTLDDDSVSQDVEGGEDKSVTLNLTAGIGWHCEYHPDTMKGTITVS
jgi:plastocyanin